MAPSLQTTITDGAGVARLIDSPQSVFPTASAVLTQAVQERAFPGCAFAILAEGQMVAEAAGRFTYEEGAAQVTPRTVYDLASLTKVLATTAACMWLYDRGLLALDAPVAELLPAFLAAEPRDRRRTQVTMRMLLDHSSGLPGYVRLFEFVTGRQEMIDACLRQPLIADPGSRAEYSDIGFLILGHLLEALAGEPLDAICSREIFAPLGMTSTCFHPASAARAAIPPTEDDRAFRHRIIQGEVHDENASVMEGVSGHAGLFSNATDPLRFAQCILSGGVTASGERLFRAQTIALFAKRTAQPAASSRALGWDTPSVPSSSGRHFSADSVGHLGFTGTSLWIDLDARVAVTLLTNRTWPDRSSQAIRDVRPRFHDALRTELSAQLR